MPSPPPAGITITTDENVLVPGGVATLVLPANSMAAFRQVAPANVRFIWMGTDNAVTTSTGHLRTRLRPFEERQIGTFSAMYTGDVYAVHNIMTGDVFVHVVEGEST